MHTDPAAAQLSGMLEARAFTVGEHIAFGHGEYRPGTTEGALLLAHELAHVAQQEGLSAETGSASEASLEREADDFAQSAIGGLLNGPRSMSIGNQDKRSKRGSRLGLRLQRKTADYKFQNISGFNVCVYCICERQGSIPEKVLSKGPDVPCAPGLTMEWSEGCTGWSEVSRTKLPQNPCPSSTTSCQ